MSFSFSSDLAAIIGEHNHSITYKGNSYSCVVSGLVEGEEMQIEGIYEIPELSLIMAPISPQPQPNEVITYNGKTYLVGSAKTDPYGSSLVITLKAKSK